MAEKTAETRLLPTYKSDAPVQTNLIDVKTCEFVSPKHPDKICDFNDDSILDAYLKQDKKSRVAVEVMGGHNLITINGEVTSNAEIDHEKLVKDIVGNNYKIIVNIVKQSSFIASGVDTGGAGDQGIMLGYACNETPNLMPVEYEFARDLCRKIYAIYPFDGKVQVTVGDGKILAVVASFQNTNSIDLGNLVRSIINADEYFINPAGEWSLGGFDADSGISGRKLIVDNYGPELCIGGGSFSGKDYTKVDRSGAYMARKISIDLIHKNKAKKGSTKLSYTKSKTQTVIRIALIKGETFQIKV